MLAQPGPHNERIKVPDQRLAAAFLIPQSLALRVTNSPSDAISMKSLIERIEAGPKVEPMPPIDITLPKASLGTEQVASESHFDILPSL